MQLKLSGALHLEVPAREEGLPEMEGFICIPGWRRVPVGVPGQEMIVKEEGVRGPSERLDWEGRNPIVNKAIPEAVAFTPDTLLVPA